MRPDDGEEFMKHWNPLFLFFSFFFVLTARAEGIQAPFVLTWDNVVSCAEKNPGLLRSQSQVRAAEGEVSAARQYPNPDLTFSRAHGEALKGGESGLAKDIEVSVPLEWVLLRHYRQKAARTGVDIARLEEQAARLTVLLELRLSYLTVAYDQALIISLSESSENLKSLVEVVKLRVDKGEARPVELIRMESEYAEAQAELDKTKEEAAANRKRLAVWLGNDIPEDFRVELDLETLPSLPELDEAISRAQTGYPLIKAAQARVLQAEARVNAAKQAAFPTVSVGSFYNEELDARYYGGTLTVSLPLWNWNLGEVQKAKAEQQTSVYENDLTDRKLREEVIRLHGSAKALLQSINRYSDKLLPQNAEILRILETSYRVGETGLIDVLDARRQSARIKAAYLGLLVEYRTLWTELNTLMGNLNHV
jgi:outer membrane protein, heavy metal efflux system